MHTTLNTYEELYHYQCHLIFRYLSFQRDKPHHVDIYYHVILSLTTDRVVSLKNERVRQHLISQHRSEI